MGLKDLLVSQFDHEMAITRRTLERVPEDQLAWKPHQKSMTMGRLAGHVAELPRRTVPMVGAESLDIAPPGGPTHPPNVATSQSDLLAFFDRNVSDARAALADTSDEHLMKPWTLIVGGKAVRTMPRMAALQNMVLHHGIHHRAQLGLYLRLNDIPVPATYGPSADERPMM
ncbi:MAG: DinB family protein [Acidobacteria bacterium]|nr:DinB family protein [Acidobacteriota bacterium]